MFCVLHWQFKACCTLYQNRIASNDKQLLFCFFCNSEKPHESRVHGYHFNRVVTYRFVMGNTATTLYMRDDLEQGH